METVAQEYSAHVLACNIYIVEAHPVDGWSLPNFNEDVGVCYKKPTTTQERVAVATRFVADYAPVFETLVDSIEDTVELAYEARPERLYVLSPATNTVVYRSGPGPYQYSVPKLRAFFASLFPAAQ